MTQNYELPLEATPSLPKKSFFSVKNDCSTISVYLRKAFKKRRTMNRIKLENKYLIKKFQLLKYSIFCVFIKI